MTDRDVIMMNRKIYIGMMCALLIACRSICTLADEGRIPLYQLDVPIVITNSGSYVVAEPLSPDTGLSAPVVIQADNVDLDLNGFKVESGLFVQGIYQNPDNQNLVVYNGTVSGELWALGSQNRISNIKVIESLRDAIRTGSYATIKNCLVTSNAVLSATNALIRMADGGSISDTRLVGNTVLTGVIGVMAGGGLQMERCLITDGSGPGLLIGVQAGDGAMLHQVTVRDFSSAFATNGADVTCLELGNNAIVTEFNGDGSVALGRNSMLLDSVFSDCAPQVAPLTLTAGKGSVLARNVINAQDHSSVTTGQGCLLKDNHLEDSVMECYEGSLVIGNYFSEKVVSQNDCYLTDNYLLSGIVVTGCCNRVDGNFVQAPLSGGNEAAFDLPYSDSLIVRNLVSTNTGAVVASPGGDHIAELVDQSTITENKPWANVEGIK